MSIAERADLSVKPCRFLGRRCSRLFLAGGAAVANSRERGRPACHSGISGSLDGKRRQKIRNSLGPFTTQPTGKL